MMLDSAVALAPLAGIAALAGAATLVATLVAGVLALGNLALLGWLAARVTDQLAAGRNRSAAAAGALLGVKSLLVLAILAGLMTVLDPLGVALGISCVVLGGLLGGLLRQALWPAESAVDTAQES
jgi:hypothetical protein